MIFRAIIDDNKKENHPKRSCVTMSNIEMIQKLLKDKADLQAQINISSFDGSIEIKTVNNEKYI